MYKKNWQIFGRKIYIKEIEVKEVQFISVGDFLSELKREFGEGNDESVKVAELKRIE